MGVKIKVSCFYGSAQPGDIVDVDADEADRLVAIKAGARVAGGSGATAATAAPKAPKAPKAPEDDLGGSDTDPDGGEL